MRLTASDLYSYLRPAPCELRVHLLHKGEQPGPPGELEKLLLDLGKRHEATQQEALDELLGTDQLVDLSGLDRAERIDATIRAVADGAPVIFQGAFKTELELSGIRCEIVGDPDLLIRRGSGYVVQDIKLARRITSKDHPEILASVQLYGWLYKETFGEAPGGLEILAGDGSVVVVSDDHGASALALVAEVLAAKIATEEPYSPVGSSKCKPCGFSERCWKPAIERQDVAVLPGVDQGLARALRGEGIDTISELLERFDVSTLEEFERQVGTRMQKVGSKAQSILQHALAWTQGMHVVIGKLKIPQSDNYVMFDLEGVPSFLDDDAGIYLWGFQVYGKSPSEYCGAIAEAGEDGDRRVWEHFLAGAGKLFEKYGDVPWVHWSSYERIHLRRYMELHGDPDGIAQRVDDNLLDLLPVTKDALALPITSYGLKIVEGYVGYRRSQTEYGGDWSIAQYVEAVECQDAVRRHELFEEILTYNKEDLEATWAVFDWVRQEAG